MSSYPTIIFFASGDDKEAFVYTEADQSVDALVKLVNKECGSQRAVDGGYVGSRGEIGALSGLVAKFKGLRGLRLLCLAPRLAAPALRLLAATPTQKVLPASLRR